MDVLKKYRSYLIAMGRFAAGDIALRQGTVHSREVRQTLDDAGLLDPVCGDFWLGAVFRGSYFEWTGVWHTYTDSGRNIHERTIKVWRLVSLQHLPPRPMKATR